MTARPVFVKLAAFFFAFAAAVALAALFTPAPRRPSGARARPAASDYPTREFAPAENLRSEVELVTVDRESGRTYTSLKLRLVGHSRAPEKLWVRTHFFNPSAPSLHIPAGDPVAVVRPFDGDSSANVVVSSACSWCGDAGAPESGYFANVEIYEYNYDEKPHTLGSQFVDLTTAVPVVVHAESAPHARR